MRVRAQITNPEGEAAKSRFFAQRPIQISVPRGNTWVRVCLTIEEARAFQQELAEVFNLLREREIRSRLGFQVNTSEEK